MHYCNLPFQDISRETLGFSPQILVLSGSGDKHLLKTTFIFSYSLNSPKMDIREGELGRVMTDEAFNPYSVNYLHDRNSHLLTYAMR